MKYNEGGKILSLKIFGCQNLIKLNIFQVCFILDENKWNLNYNEFRKEFENINGNIEYVKEILIALEHSVDKYFAQEIKDVIEHEEQFLELCKQTVYSKIEKEKDDFEELENDDDEEECIYLGRCQFDLERRKNVNYNK